MSGSGQRAAGPGSGLRVEGVLRAFETLREERLDGVRGALGVEVQLFALGGGEVAQDERRGVHPARRASDAESHPQVVASAEALGDRTQAVVPVVAAAPLQAQRAVRDVALVVADAEPV